jgi:subtilisin-like proprotein convertase family protein
MTDTQHRHRTPTRLLAGIVGGTLAAAAALLAAPTAQAASAEAANPTAIALPDSWAYKQNFTPINVPAVGTADLYPSPVTFSGLVGTVVDVDVELHGVQHQFFDDLDVMLVGPGGQRALIMSDAGGVAGADVDLFIDDDAPSALPDTGPISSGNYRPTNYGAGDTFPAPAPTPTGSALSVFDGTNPNGVWQLYVVDDFTGDSGGLDGWTISVRTNQTPSLYPAPISVTGLAGSVTDVDVTLHGLQHTYPDDLDALVIGPGGQRALVMADMGGDTDVSGVTLVLDDEAGSPLPDQSVLQSGIFRPADSDAYELWSDNDKLIGAPGNASADGSALTVFDGTDPNGVWQLYIGDDGSSDTGTLAGGWSLRITTTDPAPTPAPVPASGGTTPASPTSKDTVHPRVSATTPGAGATRVGPAKNVRATFNEPVRRSTLTSASVKLVRKGTTVRIPATLTYNPATHTVTIDPSRRLRHHTTYKVIVTTGVKDIAGHALDQKPSVTGNQKARWTFTTASGVGA